MEFLLKGQLWQHPNRNETHKKTYLNQFLGIVVPRSRDGRMEGSPGRLVRIFYDFRFFHTSRSVGLIFSVASLMKCDLLNFRQWHFRSSYIQNTSCEFSSQNELLQGVLFSHCNYLSLLDSCWESILLRYVGLVSNRSNTEPLCVRTCEECRRPLTHQRPRDLIERPLDSV